MKYFLGSEANQLKPTLQSFTKSSQPKLINVTQVKEVKEVFCETTSSKLFCLFY